MGERREREEGGAEGGEVTYLLQCTEEQHCGYISMWDVRRYKCKRSHHALTDHFSILSPVNYQNYFGGNVNASLLMDLADAMVHSGLLDAGYGLFLGVALSCLCACLYVCMCTPFTCSRIYEAMSERKKEGRTKGGV